MKAVDIFLILISVAFTSIAQLLLKFAMNSVGKVDFSLDGIFSLFCKSVKNIYFYSGVFVFALSLLIWLFVLSRVPVSVAYPFVGVGCIFTMLFAFIFLNESISLSKIVGVMSVCLGIILISR